MFINEKVQWLKSSLFNEHEPDKKETKLTQKARGIFHLEVQLLAPRLPGEIS